ncbi:hypothetical protein DSL72_008322 [Monilinia vaccinii-corymbosi]|uniref:BZIP domain-containing protein n=1 Tax=Monilinia vaccinii-corymbosi TaxID=61207 RepID=A0A8A3PJF8_9HELO|nr:hypothetical protein DSL72_008322 [Monilinia vaccinii-corymbosi]
MLEPSTVWLQKIVSWDLLKKLSQKDTSKPWYLDNATMPAANKQPQLVPRGGKDPLTATLETFHELWWVLGAVKIFDLAVQGPLSRPLRESPSFVAFAENAHTPPELNHFPGTPSSELLERRLSDFVSKLHSYQQSWEGEGTRQCPGPRDQEGLGDQDSMSQRLSAPRPASRSPPESQKITLPPVQVRDDPRHGGRQADRPLEPDNRGLQKPHHTLPSPSSRTLQSVSSGEDWKSSGPSRDLGVHSILNPTEPESASSSGRRLSGGTTGSPLSTTAGPTSHFGASPSVATTHPYSNRPPVSTSPSLESFNPNFPRGPTRRMLTPRSPRPASISRAAVHGTINTPEFPSRRPEPGQAPASENPPIPTPPGQAPAQHYGFPPTGTAPVDKRTDSSQMQAPGRVQHSASPSISASSQTPSQTSPASGYLYHQSGQNPQTSGSYFPGSSFGSSVQPGSGLQLQAPPAASEGPYTASQIGSSLHSNTSSIQASASEPYGVLTITTAHGVAYHVPVDTHQASRLADEKRARNAGASARFRQRRKEKEKEASSNIEKLQSQTRELERRLRDAEGERDFYRGERDRFRDMLLRNPGTRDMALHGPPSPRSMRPVSSYPGPPPPSSGPPMSFQGPEDERAARRRRTDAQGDFVNVPYSHSPASSLPPVQTGFPPAHGQGLPNLPPLRIDNPSTGLTTGATTPSISAGPPSFDSYSRASYDRAWPKQESSSGRR